MRLRKKTLLTTFAQCLSKVLGTMALGAQYTTQTMSVPQHVICWQWCILKYITKPDPTVMLVTDGMQSLIHMHKCPHKSLSSQWVCLTAEAAMPCTNETCAAVLFSCLLAFLFRRSPKFTIFVKIGFHCDIVESILKHEANGKEHIKNSNGKLRKEVIEHCPQVTALWHPSRSCGE